MQPSLMATPRAYRPAPRAALPADRSSVTPGQAQPGEAIQDQGSGDGDVEARAGADHRDGDDLVDQGPGFRRDAVAFVSEQHDAARSGCREIAERGRVVGELHRVDAAAGRTLALDPGELRAIDPVHVRPSAPQRVAALRAPPDSAPCPAPPCTHRRRRRCATASPGSPRRRPRAGRRSGGPNTRVGGGDVHVEGRAPSTSRRRSTGRDGSLRHGADRSRGSNRRSSDPTVR